MIACYFSRLLLVGVVLASFSVAEAAGGTEVQFGVGRVGMTAGGVEVRADGVLGRDDRGAAVDAPTERVRSNVPLNEINTRAFRRFQQLFPRGTDEYWTKSDEGYLISFEQNSRQYRAHFDLRGNYLYSLQYYRGEEASRDLAQLILKKYPGYQLGVITEITDGVTTFYMVRIQNTAYVKTLSVSDGKINLVEDLINGAGDLANSGGR